MQLTDPADSVMMFIHNLFRWEQLVYLQCWVNVRELLSLKCQKIWYLMLGSCVLAGWPAAVLSQLAGMTRTETTHRISERLGVNVIHALSFVTMFMPVAVTFLPQWHATEAARRRDINFFLDSTNEAVDLKSFSTRWWPQSWPIDNGAYGGRF